MRIIVTGASGIVGAGVLAAGRGGSHTMLGVSRRADGPEMVRVEDYRDSPEGDVLLHLAQPAARNVDPSAVLAAVALFEQLCARPWRRIVYASSAAIYGALAGDLDEDRPLVAEDAYSRIKQACELICLRHAGAVLRLSNIVSAPPAAGTVCADILDQIPGDGPVVVRNAYAQLDLLSVDDAARGMVAAAVGEAVGVFHLAYGQSVSVRQVAQAALAGAGCPDRAIVSRIDLAPSSAFRLDVSRAASRLGWSAQTDPLMMIAAMAKQRTARSHE